MAPHLEAHALQPHLQAWHHLAISGPGAKRGGLLETWPRSLQDLQEHLNLTLNFKPAEIPRLLFDSLSFSLNRAVGGSEGLLAHVYAPRDAYGAQSAIIARVGKECDSHPPGFYRFLHLVSN